jgi:hypothetical protein
LEDMKAILQPALLPRVSPAQFVKKQRWWPKLESPGKLAADGEDDAVICRFVAANADVQFVETSRQVVVFVCGRDQTDYGQNLDKITHLPVAAAKVFKLGNASARRYRQTAMPGGRQLQWWLLANAPFPPLDVERDIPDSQILWLDNLLVLRVALSTTDAHGRPTKGIFKATGSTQTPSTMPGATGAGVRDSQIVGIESLPALVDAAIGLQDEVTRLRFDLPAYRADPSRLERCKKSLSELEQCILARFALAGEEADGKLRSDCWAASARCIAKTDFAVGFRDQIAKLTMSGLLNAIAKSIRAGDASAGADLDLFEKLSIEEPFVELAPNAAGKCLSLLPRKEAGRWLVAALDRISKGELPSTASIDSVAALMGQFFEASYPIEPLPAHANGAPTGADRCAHLGALSSHSSEMGKLSDQIVPWIAEHLADREQSSRARAIISLSELETIPSLMASWGAA